MQKAADKTLWDRFRVALDEPIIGFMNMYFCLTESVLTEMPAKISLEEMSKCEIK